MRKKLPFMLNVLNMINMLIIQLCFFGCGHTSLSAKTKEVPPDSQKFAVFSQSKTQFTIRPGQLILIQHDFPNLIPSSSELLCDQEKIPFIFDQEKKHLQAYLVEDYFSERSHYSCSLQYLDSSGNLVKEIVASVKVKRKKYPLEHLKVNHKKVTLSAPDLERVTKEKELLATIYNQSAPHLYYKDNFIKPLKTKITSHYGMRRIFNDHFNTQHLGTDFRATVGTPVKAAGRGKIVFVGELFYTGNTVIMDHGLGLFAVYGHLSKIIVAKDLMAEKGDLIGLSGMTGRVTGPHLHWGVKALGHWVDGIELLHLFTEKGR